MAKKSKWEEYWDNRFAELGANAVGHFSWDAGKLMAETHKISTKVRRLLEAHEWGIEPHLSLLDYGCGVGRFLELFKHLGFEAFGADLSRSMVDFCRGQGYAGLRKVSAGNRLPFKKASFDAIWCCTVLQHVPEAEFGPLCAELRRVLKPGGIVALFENTHPVPAGKSASGHVVFRSKGDYTGAFPGIQAKKHWLVEGEEHTLFFGSLKG